MHVVIKQNEQRQIHFAPLQEEIIKFIFGSAMVHRRTHATKKNPSRVKVFRFLILEVSWINNMAIKS